MSCPRESEGSSDKVDVLLSDYARTMTCLQNWRLDEHPQQYRLSENEGISFQCFLSILQSTFNLPHPPVDDTKLIMKREELLQLVAQGESETLEFKKSTGQRTAAAKTLCSMLNGQGGIILFGVTDKREVVGQKVSVKTLENLASEFRKIDPQSKPCIDKTNIGNGLSIVVVEVSPGGGPFTFDGRAYMRVGPTTQQMTRRQYERSLLFNLPQSERWEMHPATNVTLDDLDISEITRIVEEAIRRNRLDDPQTRDPMELMRGLGVLSEDGRIAHAAVILFGKRERLALSYPQCLLKLARFKGKDKTEFIDNRQEYGNAFDMLRRSQRFFRDHLPVAGRVVPEVFERIDDPLYPPIALREAIANAICHRDYGAWRESLDVAIYEDRIEIINPGYLPPGVTPKTLFRPHRSRPWNPHIAQVFFRAGIIETWGRGTIKMRDLSLAAGCPAPGIEVSDDYVLVRFRPPEGRTHGPGEPESQPESRPESQPESIQEKVLKLLESGPFSKSELAFKLGQKQISGQLKKVLLALAEEGRIEFTIPDKPTSRLQKYRLVGKGKEEEK